MNRVALALCAVVLPLLAGCQSRLLPRANHHLTQPCDIVSNRAMSALLGSPVTGVPKGHGEVPPCEWETSSGHRRHVVLYTYRYDATFADALHLIDDGAPRRVPVVVPGADDAVGRIYSEPHRRQVVVAMRDRQLALAFVTGVDDADGLRIARDTIRLLFRGRDLTSSVSS